MGKSGRKFGAPLKHASQSQSFLYAEVAEVLAPATHACQGAVPGDF